MTHWIRLLTASARAVIPGESATAPEPELRIACEGEQEPLGRIDAMIRMAGGGPPAPSLSHMIAAIHEKPDEVAQASGRAGVREAVHARNDEVLPEPE